MKFIFSFITCLLIAIAAYAVTNTSNVNVGFTQGGNELYVNSGGTISIDAGALDIGSSATLDVESGGDLNINSGGSFDVNSGGVADIESGGDLNIAGTLDVNTGGIVDVETGGALTVRDISIFQQNISITDITSTNSGHGVVPYPGTISSLVCVSDGTVTGGETITANINGVAITTGTVVFSSGSVAYSEESNTPTGANTVAANDLLTFTSAGDSSGTVGAHCTAFITP